jgi:hypothetical protein
VGRTAPSHKKGRRLLTEAQIRQVANQFGAPYGEVWEDAKAQVLPSSNEAMIHSNGGCDFAERGDIWRVSVNLHAYWTNLNVSSTCFRR